MGIQEELVDRLGLTPAVAEQHKMELQLLLRFHNWNSYTAEEALRKNTLDAMEQAGILTQNAKLCKCGGNPKCLFCDGTGISSYYTPGTSSYLHQEKMKQRLEAQIPQSPKPRKTVPKDYFRTQMQKELERRNSISEINLDWINFQAEKLAEYHRKSYLLPVRYWTNGGAEWFNNQPLPKNATARRRLASMGPAAQCLARRRLATGGPRTPPVLAALMAEIEEAKRLYETKCR